MLAANLLSLSFQLLYCPSISDEIKLWMVSDDAKKMSMKLDNMLMVFILHGLHKD